MPSCREFLRAGLTFGALAASVPVALSALTTNFRFDPDSPLIAAPRNPADWPEFRRRLAEWRDTRRRGLNYSDALYRRPEFAWARRCCCCCFLMLCDETFYDHRRGRYTLNAFLDHGVREFGGYESSGGLRGP